MTSRLSLIAAFVIGVGVAPGVAGADHEIAVLSSAIEPSMVRVALDERVTFVNRSGRAIHVEMTGPEGERHLFHLYDTMWVEFHRPGRHPFVVHFYTGRRVDVRGVVDVEAETRSLPLSECAGFTVDDLCIDR